MRKRAAGAISPAEPVATPARPASKWDQRRQIGRPDRARAYALVVGCILLGAGIPSLAIASHPQAAPVGAVKFTQVSGNEWWVQVRILGPVASSVQARDTGGPWVQLQAQSWTNDRTWWAASFRIEPGNQVMFGATFSGANAVESCWFDHPGGTERCQSAPPPPPSGNFDATFAGVRGNEWWVQASVSTTGGTLSMVHVNIHNEWKPLPRQSWGGWAASYRVVHGTVIQLRATSTAGETDLSACYTWIPAANQDATQVTCGSTPPPPPPPTGDFDATFAGVRGNEWWVQASVSTTGGTLSMVHVNINDEWKALPRQSWGGWAASYRVVQGTVIQLRATSTAGETDLSACYTWVPAANQDATKVTCSGTTSGPWIIASSTTASWSFDWSGGPGHVVVDAATTSSSNLRPDLRIEVRGDVLREAPVGGPVARPALAQFDLPAGRHAANFTAIGGTVIVSAPGAAATAPAASFAGADARVHVGGSQAGTGWRFTDYGYLDSRLVVNETGWYLLRVQGAGTINDVGPLVHLWLNRTVVAEGVQGSTIDLSVRHHLTAGVGYTLGAAFENPWPDRTATFDILSATATTEPSPPPPPVPVDAPGDPAGWPQYGRDGYNSRHNPDPSLPTTTTAPSLRLEWRTNLDGSVTSTPTVVDGRVYVGTWGKSMYALNQTTGAVLWRTPLAHVADGSAAVADGKVVINNGNSVLALNATTGAVVWTTSFSGRHWSSPTIDGDAVFVGLGSGNGHVARLALANGSITWITATAPTNAGARVWASPLVPPGSGLVVVGTSPGNSGIDPPTMDSLIAFDRETGVLVWVHQFFPRDQNLESTHEETLLSNRDISGTPHLAFIDGRPVVLASQKHGPAWIVDLTDGSLVSGSRLLDHRPALIGSGGVADGVRVVSSAEPDRIAGFDLVTGDLLWQQSMPGTEFAPVAIANGIVWVGSYGGHVHGFDLHTGRQVALLDAGGGVLGGVSLAEGTVFVGSLQKPSGSVLFTDSLGKLPGSVSAWRVA